MSLIRMEAELALLRLHYTKVEYAAADGMHWFKVEPVRTAQGWSSEVTPVAFSVTQGHPGAEPYGFYIPVELCYEKAPPAEHSATHQPPFRDVWRFLSWAPDGWRPTADVTTGSNLWGWVRSFVRRFEEGR